MIPELGKRYKCIRTICMENHPSDIRFIEGKIYKSEEKGCLTDETGLKGHIWTKLEGTFVRASNKRKRSKMEGPEFLNIEKKIKIQ
jgi:hypothetical protein